MEYRFYNLNREIAFTKIQYPFLIYLFLLYFFHYHLSPQYLLPHPTRPLPPVITTLLSLCPFLFLLFCSVPPPPYPHPAAVSLLSIYESVAILLVIHP